MLFGNLISNAIKYSMPESTITIRFKKGVFTIQDEGIGIAQEKLSKIFERYNRQSDYAGGFGIGLSIVQKIAKEYGITVDVQSEKEKGTCFTLVFTKENL
jgi:two-component system OmpR family sensor kinase